MKLRNTSASQVDGFNRCQRYWFFGWVLKLKGPTTPAMQRGTDIHSLIEHWLNTGNLILPSGVKHPKHALEVLKLIAAEQGENPHDAELVKSYYQHALAAAKLLSSDKIQVMPKSKDLIVEQRIEIPTGKDLPYWLGFIDIGWSGRANKPLLILDTKTTSDFRYAKTKDELSKNPQVISYAHWAYEVMGYPGDTIEVGHAYIHTKTHKTKLPNTKFVSCEVSREHVANIWERDVAHVRTMVDIAANVTDPQELEPTTTACGMYGGCPHLERCGIAKEAFTNYFTSNNQQKSKTQETIPMSALLDKLRKAQGKEAPAKTEAAAPAKAEAKPEPKVEAAEVPTGVLPDDAPERTTPIKTEEEKVAEVKAAEPKEKKPRKKRAAKKADGGFVIYQNCFPTKGGDGIIRYEDWFKPLFEVMDQTAAENNGVAGYWSLSFAQQKDFLAKSVSAYIEENGLPDAMLVMGSPMLASDVMPHLAARAVTVVNAVR